MGRTSTEVRNRWNAKNYFKINITIPKGNKELVARFAESQGLSVNGLLNQLIRKELGVTTCEWGMDPAQNTNQMMKDSMMV